MREKLAEIGDTQIGVTDGDARALLEYGDEVVEVAYNVQAAVDDQHNLVVATHTINKNDRNARCNSERSEGKFASRYVHGFGR
ncbi:MAG: hypothetical protein U0T77_12590 [Chitinophagales bacterium]